VRRHCGDDDKQDRRSDVRRGIEGREPSALSETGRHC
jgi:hypothetical protein